MRPRGNGANNNTIATKTLSWTLEDRKQAHAQNLRTWVAKGVETAEPWQHSVKESTNKSLSGGRISRLLGTPYTGRQFDQSISEFTEWSAERSHKFDCEYEETSIQYDKDLNYKHGPLHNVPAHGCDCQSVLGYKGQALGNDLKRGADNLNHTISLDALTYEVEDSYEGLVEEVSWDEVLDTYQDEEVYDYDAPTNRSEVLGWAEQVTKPESWEACLLWAHGKTFSDTATIQGVSKSTAQSRIERTLGRLQVKVRTQHT